MKYVGRDQEEHASQIRVKRNLKASTRSGAKNLSTPCKHIKREGIGRNFGKEPDSFSFQKPVNPVSSIGRDDVKV